jgi:hypothetical protein
LPIASSRAHAKPLGSTRSLCCYMTPGMRSETCWRATPYPFRSCQESA